jgi:hypothetical protein
VNGAWDRHGHEGGSTRLRVVVSSKEAEGKYYLRVDVSLHVDIIAYTITEITDEQNMP